MLFIQSIKNDTSSITHTNGGEIFKDRQESESKKEKNLKFDKLFSNSSVNDVKKISSKRNRVKIKKTPYKYKATQVILREENDFDREKTIPMGTNMIGKLLTSIDTRESEQFYKVFLPYGGGFKGGAKIPKGSTLFGKIRYSAKGSKVFINFQKGVFPNGEEFEIQAQALSSKDYSPGIRGDFHGQTGMRVAATLGLSMVSGASSVLTERETSGIAGVTPPKSTLKNALYGGLSQASQTESARQAEKLNENTAYVTIDAGKDLIINLTQRVSIK